jgi:hypothetical protein
LADSSGLIVGAESVSALDVSNTEITRLEVRYKTEVMKCSRHENSCQHLEEQPDHIEESREDCANSGAQRQQAGQEWADGKEEANQDKGEHESSQIKELPRPNEL